MEKMELEAVYENGALKLPCALPLQEGEKVKITIHPTGSPVQRLYGLVPWKGDLEEFHRWLNDPIFVAELEARRDEIVESMLDQHLLASRMATAKLMGLIDSPNEQIALRAAAILYAGGQRAYQFMDVRKRIERLEDNMGIVYGSKV